ncbi:MAG: arsenate reductase ArsC [Verrucomicrobiota bacterium]
MNPKTPLKVLILCTGNSARSIIGEYLLRVRGKGRFEVHSAGAKPTGRINPLAQWVLKEHYGIDTSDARSKSWDEFKSVPLDFVITVCDNAKESCPIWPGKPVLAHWGSPDPAGVEGTEEQKKRAFVDVAVQIARRVDLLCALPPESLTEAHVRKIGTEARLAGEADMAR